MTKATTHRKVGDPAHHDTAVLQAATQDTVEIPGGAVGDRRTLPRHPLAPPVEVLLQSAGNGAGNGRSKSGTVVDVGEQGLRVRLRFETSEPPFALGSEVAIALAVDGPRLPVLEESRTGRVAWVSSDEGGWLLGLHFLNAGHDGLLDLDRIKIDPIWALRIPASMGLRRKVLPFAADDHCVHVACGDHPDGNLRLGLERALGMPVRFETAEPTTLKRALDRVYGDLPAGGFPRQRSVDLRTLQDVQSEDVVGVCDELLHAAILRQASDIHIDPEVGGVHIRFRVDGVLDTYRRLPANVHGGIISRFKVLAGMDIAEKRAPQDGGFKHRYGRGVQAVDIRAASLPTRHGERMTLRLLALQTESLTLENLGMSAPDLVRFEAALDRPHGMILLTGPTGSGKSTTLYAAMRRLLHRESLNILTVEDPIEYEMAGVAQIEVDQADKVTFLKALRSLLRHDPDVLMIGEIRDAQTADIAIKASLTGHLVFSTLHTNSAASVVTRLIDMGVERYLVAATLRLGVAQRLVRRLCPRCRRPRPITAPEAAAFRRPPGEQILVHEPVGCIYCNGRGFAGRLGLFEMLPLDDDWSRSIAEGASEAELIARMREHRLATLLEDGFDKVRRGLASVQEVLNAVTAW